MAAAVQAKQIYSFPLMKNGDILSSMHTFGLPLKEDELLNPENHRDNYKNLLEILAEQCTGIPREEMNQPTFEGLKVLEYPDMHEHSIPFLHSFRAMQAMMETCGIHDFSIRDLMVPSYKRYRRQLSGIINFLKFRDERLSLLQDVNAATSDLAAKLKSLDTENEMLNKKLALLREQSKEDEEVIMEKEAECREIEEQISDLNNQQAEIKEECKQLKTYNNELKDTLAQQNIEMEELTILKKQLQAQVVNSPERFKKQIVDVNIALQQEQKDVKAAEKKLKELTGWLTAVDDVQAEVDEALEAISNIRSEVEKQKHVMAEVEAAKAQLAEANSDRQKVEAQVQESERSIAKTEEKLSLLRRGAAERAAEHKKKIDDMREQILLAEQARLDLNLKIERGQAEVAKKEREAAAEKLAQEQELVDMTSAYHRLERVVAGHLQGLRKAIEADENAAPQHLNVA